MVNLTATYKKSAADTFMKLTAIFLATCLFLISCSPSGKTGKIAGKELLSDSAVHNAHVGICVFDAASSRFLYTYQSDKYFIPASNIKLFTLDAALRYLGDSITGIEYAHTDSGLWIRPAGDPSFLNPQFPQQPVYRFLQSSSGKKIFLAWPDRLPERYGNGWMMADMTEGETLPRSVFPVYGHVPLYQNNEKTYLPLGPDNGEASAQFLSDTLAAQVLVMPEPKGLSWKKLHSLPTDSLLRSMMLRSDNHLAEHILLMAARAKLGIFREDVLIDSILANELKQMPKSPRWVDGSGASRYNLATPESMVYLLEAMRKSYGLDRMKKLLPTGGEGTLSKYYLDMAGSIYAKTGTLSNNQALSGFLITRKGTLLTFSIMVNNYRGPARPIRQKVETMLREIWQKI